MFTPDIVFVNNDNALKYVAVEYTKMHTEKKLPFVFSGVNLDPSIYAGVIGGEILGGATPATIAIIDPKVTDVTFNIERAEMLGLSIPATELAYATAVLHYVPFL